MARLELRYDGPGVTKAEAAPELCQWFFLCENEATTARSHPILGDVPICERCADKIDQLDSEIRRLR